MRFTVLSISIFVTEINYWNAKVPESRDRSFHTVQVIIIGKSVCTNSCPLIRLIMRHLRNCNPTHWIHVEYSKQSTAVVSGTVRIASTEGGATGACDTKVWPLDQAVTGILDFLHARIASSTVSSSTVCEGLKSWFGYRIIRSTSERTIVRT